MHTYTQGGGKGGPKMGPGPHQVSKLQKTTTLSTNAQSIVVLGGFQGPLRLAWYKQVSLFFCISGTQRMRRGHFIGAVPAQKVLKGSETETRELLGGTDVERYFPDKGSFIGPPGKSTSFYQSGPPEI